MFLLLTKLIVYLQTPKYLRHLEWSDHTPLLDKIFSYFCDFLVVLLLALKLTGTSISLVWVFSPYWIPLSIMLGACILLFAIGFGCLACLGIILGLQIVGILPEDF